MLFISKTGIVGGRVDISTLFAEVIGADRRGIKNLWGNSFLLLSGAVGLSACFSGGDLTSGGGPTPIIAGSQSGETHTGTAGNGYTLEAAAGETANLSVTLIDDATGTLTVSDLVPSSFSGDFLVGIQNLTGGEGDDTFTGNMSDNKLSGMAGADKLNGGGGDDTLTGGDGSDILTGGTGIDTVSYADSTAGVTVDIGVIVGRGTADRAPAVTPTIAGEGGDADGDTFVDAIENIEGSEHDDILWGNSKANKIEGMGGNDSLVGNGGADTLMGGAGIDTLYGGMGADTLNGGDGVDTLNGDAGDDILNGDAGADTLNGGDDGDTLDGGTGDDTLRGESGTDTLNGGFGNDTLMGGVDNDILDGGAGNDELNGDAGNDKLDGGSGNDILDGDEGNDELTGGSGADTFVVSVGTDTWNDFGSGDAVTFDSLTTVIKAATDLGIDFFTSGTVSVAGLEGDRLMLSFSSAGAGSAIDSAIIFANEAVASGALDSVAARVVNSLGLPVAPVITDSAGNDIMDAMASVDENVVSSFYTVFATDANKADILNYRISGGADKSLFEVDSDGEVSFRDDGDGANFELPTDAGGDNTYNVQVEVSDGTTTASLTDKLDIAVVVENVNEGPDITSASTVVVVENDPSAFHTVVASDPESSASVTYSISSGSDLFEIASDGAIKFSGTAGGNFEDGAIHTIEVSATEVTDGVEGLTTTQSVTVTLTDINESPTITTSETANYDFNNTDPVILTFSVRDEDGMGVGGTTDSLTFSITSGAQSSLFTIDSGSGELGFTTAAKPVTANVGDEYEVFVKVSDGVLSDDHSLTVSVSSRPNTVVPSFTSISPVYRVDEGFTGDAFTIGAIDDGFPSSLKYDLLGVPASLTSSISIDNSGVVSITRGIDYDESSDVAGNSYVLTVTVNDGDGAESATISRSFTLQVDDIPGDPAVTDPQRVLVNLNSDGPVFLDGETVTASEVRYFDLASGDESTSLATSVVGDDYTAVDTTTDAPDVYFIGGNFRANTITASDGADTIFGYGGADRLVGKADADVLHGGSGDDTLNGDAGDDTLHGDFGNDDLLGGADSDTLNGGDGNDVLDGGFGNDVLDGGVGADDLNGREGDDLLTGGGDGDTFTVSVGADTITDFGDGDKLIFTSAGVSSLAYSATMDNKLRIDFDTTSDGTNDSSVIFSNIAASDSATAETAFTTMILASSTFHPLTFSGVAAATSHEGKLGSDTVTYASDTAAITITLSDGSASGTATVGGFAANDTLSSIENLIGGMGDDVLTGGAGDNRLEGGVGTDTLNGGLGDDVLVGGDGTDTLNGDGGDDTLDGGADDDTLNGGADNDLLIGGGGIDTLNGDGGDDVLRGGIGNDKLFGGSHSITGDWASYLGSNAVTITLQDDGSASGAGQIGGGNADGDTLNGIENLEGGSLNDRLTGNSGDNWLRGGAGDDTLNGGGGSDTASYYHERRTPNEGVSIKLQEANVRAGLGAGHAFGTDQISGDPAGKDRLLNIENIDGTIQRDVLVGNSVANKFMGRAGSDDLTGGGGDDILDGGADNDNLFGDGGDDILRGGSGKDNLTGGAGSDTLDGGSGVDTASYFGDNSGALFITLGADGAETRGYGGNAEGDLLSNIESISSGNGADILVGNSFDNIIIGAGGADVIDGGDGDDTLQGGSDDDTFIISRGDDNIDFSSANRFGAGSDTISFANFAHIIDEASASFSFSVTSDNKLMVSFDSDGTAGAERSSIEFSNVDASGGAEAAFSANVLDYIDYYVGGGAIVATSAVETHTGVAANDFAVGVPLLSAALTVTLAANGSASVISGGNLEGDTLVSIANLVGGAGDDIFTGNAGANRLEGRIGADTLSGGTGDDELIGGRGSDTLDGGAGDDVLTGGEGSDTFIVSSGSDTITDLRAGGGLISFAHLTHIQDADDFTYMVTSDNKLQVSFDYSGDGSVDSTLTFSDIPASDAASAESAFMSEVVLRGDFAAQTFTATSGADTTFTGGLSDSDVVDYSASGAATNGAGVVLTFSAGGSATGSGGGADMDVLSSIEHVIGSGGADTLTVSGGGSYRFEGGAGGDVLTGGTGADTLLGGMGADTLLGGAGGDRIDGGVGIDTLSHAGESARIVLTLGEGETGTAAISGSSANRGDIITSIENIIGSNGNDDLTGNSGANKFEGGFGNDTLYGGAGADILLGGSGDDTLNGGVDDDTLDGGAGSDRLTGGAGSDTFIVSAGGTPLGSTDVISDFNFSEDVLSFGGIGSVLSSSNFNSGVFSVASGDFAGRFQLRFDGDGNGRNSDDIIIFSNIAVGSDSFGDIVSRFMSSIIYSDPLTASSATGEEHVGSGENGFTLEAVSGESADLTVTLVEDRAGTVTIADSPSSSFSGDTLVNIQSLTGGDGSDTFTGNKHDNVFRGGAGDDVFVSGLGNDKLYGGAGADTLRGGVGELASGTDRDNDFLDGGAGDDLLEGGIESDELRGGADSDILDGGVGDDILVGGLGSDIFVASFMVDIFSDFLVGVNVVDFSFLSSTVTITPTNSNGNLSLVYDGDGKSETALDMITFSDISFDNLDSVSSNVPDESVTATFNDNVAGRIIRNRVTGDDSAETLTGTVANDLVLGKGGNDELFGLGGNDFLRGDSGDDVLDGGAGDDILVGGDGADTFVISSLGTDVISDFGRGSDRLDFTNISGITEFADAGFAFDVFGEGLLRVVFDADGSGVGTVMSTLIFSNISTEAEFSAMVSGNIDYTSFASFSATDGADTTFTGGMSDTDLVSYAADGSTTGMVGVTLSITNGAATGAGGAAGDILESIEHVIGSKYDDTLTGVTGSYIFEGGLGADTLSGGSGDDTLIGGEGNDILAGGSGTNVLDGGGGNDRFRAGVGTDTISGGLGLDTVTYVAGAAVTVTLGEGTGTATVSGAAAGDTLTSIENLIGSDAGDTLTGNSGANVLDGGAGGDTLTGGGGADTFVVSAGTDNITDLAAGDVIDFSALSHIEFRDDITIAVIVDAATMPIGWSITFDGDNDTVTANDIIRVMTTETTTLSQEDIYTATGLAYSYTATDGADTTFTGGVSDRDLVDYSAMGATTGGEGVVLNFSGDGTAMGTNGAAGDMLESIEHVIGSDFDDGFAASGGSSISYTFEGKGGTDTLQGANGADTLLGGEGNDTLLGGNGGDRIDGGAGNDTLIHQFDLVGVTITLGEGETGTATISGSSLATKDDIITSIENITGSGSADVLTGNEVANKLMGGAGDDTLEGGAGIDTLTGGMGADTFVVSSDNDVISTFSISDGDIISFKNHENVDAATVTGLGLLAGATNAGKLFVGFVSGSGTGSPTPTGFTLLNFDAADAAAASTAFDTIKHLIVYATPDDKYKEASLTTGESHTGNSGNRFGVRVPDGESAAGTVNLSDSSMGSGSGSSFDGDSFSGILNLRGGDGDDVFTGDTGDNTLIGGMGDDTLTGGAGTNTLNGGADDDTFISAGGTDTIFGGAGNDTVSYASSGIDSPSSSDISITLSDGTANASAVVGGFAAGDVLNGIENVIGGSANDVLKGNMDANKLEGGDGNDRLNGGGGDDILLGGDGNDRFIGGAGADTIDGGGDSDIVDYKVETDALTIVLNGSSAAMITGGTDVAGDILTNVEDIVGSSQASNVLTGDGMNNSLTGGVMDDKLVGGAGDDSLNGGAGTNTLTGGIGNDRVSYGEALAGVTVMLDSGGNATVTGSDFDGNSFVDTLSGIESVNGSFSDDVFGANAQVNKFDGRGGDDTVSYENDTTGVTVTLGEGTETATVSGGHAAGDELVVIENLTGGMGNDELAGNTGDNILDGGAGNDKLTGGMGADTFVISTGTDNILDFAMGDVLDFSDVGLNSGDLMVTAISGGGGYSISFDGDGDDTNANDVIMVATTLNEDALFMGAKFDVNIVTGPTVDNILMGTDGADIFVVYEGGTNAIDNFDVSQGDMISFAENYETLTIADVSGFNDNGKLHVGLVISGAAVGFKLNNIDAATLAEATSKFNDIKDNIIYGTPDSPSPAEPDTDFGWSSMVDSMSDPDFG